MKYVGLMLLLLAGCRITSWSIWGPSRTDAGPVRIVRDVVYHGDHTRQKLDLYLPEGQKDFPVVVVVHGGAWLIGDNRCCGLYGSVGEFLASQGIAAVMPNYRLSPGVQHPEHAHDLARAVAWTKQHIGAYGGRADQMLLLGHSAGGHLVTLLATDPKYLQAQNLTVGDIQGVIAVSGVYEIPPGELEVTLGGQGDNAFRLAAIYPLRDESPAKKPSEPGGTIRVNVFGPAFGDDPEVRRSASPLQHVGPHVPPMLLLTPEHELPALAKMARDFDAALQAHGAKSQLLTAERRNHNTVMFRAVSREDPVAGAILDFIRSTTRSAAGEKAPR